MLFQKMLNNECSEEELSELLDFMENKENQQQVEEWIIASYRLTGSHIPSVPDIYLQQRLKGRLQSILGKEASGKKGLLFFLAKHSRKLAAAVILGMVATGAYFWLSPGHQKAMESLPVSAIAPGAGLITLTLADGSNIALDSLQNGIVARQQGTGVFLSSGQLAYQSGEVAEAGYNTIRIPRGRLFQLILADGTRVWLNAASSLKYPTAFPGPERKVEVTGEAYFEVAKKRDLQTGAAIPFKVRINNETEVDVLGTHFNINAYPEENHIATTLLEGSVRVMNGVSGMILKPGEQSFYNQQTGKAELKKVDADQVMAWKNGVFDLDNRPLEEVMRLLSRWYNIDVVYEKGVPDIEFGGKMGRDVSLARVLVFLKKSGLHFRMEEEEKKIVIMP